MYLLALVLALVIARPAVAETRILAFGDSLTAGFGLPKSEAFPARLEAALRARGIDAAVLDGGVSGDTSAGGLARLDWSLAARPDAVIVELGANDALRGLDPAATEQNLDAILARLKQLGLPVLLAGMLAPPNLGEDYGRRFNAIYPRLAERHGVELYPFFLDGVATQRGLNQGDGLHPNAQGVAVIVDRIAPYVVRLLPGEKRG
jgi:acyl-CoA thioesterase-1